MIRELMALATAGVVGWVALPIVPSPTTETSSTALAMATSTTGNAKVTFHVHGRGAMDHPVKVVLPAKRQDRLANGALPGLPPDR